MRELESERRQCWQDNKYKGCDAVAAEPADDDDAARLYRHLSGLASAKTD
jgi:hypothetical protein